jgi:hypothetical protein
MEKITIEKILELMENDKQITLYEYYDGIFVNSKSCNINNRNDGYILSLATDKNEETTFYYYQKIILKRLPKTKLEYFEYCSRFPSETNFNDFIGIPQTLKELKLRNFKGININLIKDIICHHETAEYFEDDGIDILDDTEKYKLVNNKWIEIKN